MTVLHIDFETRSELDLRKVGLHRYARHASTDVWCMSWALDDGEPALWQRGEPFGEFKNGTGFVVMHVKDGRKVIAHNAPFELEVWNEIMVKRYGWPALKPEQTFCSMAQAYAMGLPGALEDAALALGLHVHKDMEGRAIMLKFSRPWKTEPTRWMDECPEFTVNGQKMSGKDGLARLYTYCSQDVRVERELSKLLMPLSDTERRVWLLDYRINQRGVQLDIPSVKAAVALAERTKENGNVELAKITGNAVQAVTALPALKEWIASKGVGVDGLAKQNVVDLLSTGTLPADVEQALVIRQEVGKASTAKFDVMLERAGDDGRLRQMYQYHGAGPGRWAGRAVQTHNLPRDMPKAEAVEKILALVREGRDDVIDAIFGPPLTMISKCLRSFFVAGSGKKLISGDWANVEGRGGAWFAGEQWKLDAFRAADAGTGPGIYELAYARMFNVPVESVKNPSEERQIGKVSELAFQYQGAIGSFRTMAKAYPDMRVQEMSDEKIAGFNLAWRGAHLAIAGVRVYNEQTGRWYRTGGVWNGIQKAAINAVRAPGTAFECGHPGRQAKFKVVGSFLWCLLPSGRAICYPYPKVLEGEYGPQLTYMCVPSQEDKRKGAIIFDPKNASNWARVATYGGSLFNNIVQGFCRDFLAGGMLVLDSKGAEIVLHTHDDINIEVQAHEQNSAYYEYARKNMEQIMRTPPAWAAGFPLHAKCEVMQRYGK